MDDVQRHGDNFYAKRVLGIGTPRVGLLNIGAEDSKGTDLQKQTLVRLREADAAGHLHFIGNIEAKEAIKGGCDVIVTDGFSGNILLKTMEGVGSFAGSALKGMFKKNLLTKLAALAVMPGLRDFKAQLDPNKVGGTAFIGISKPVIKAHGASNAEGRDIGEQLCLDGSEAVDLKFSHDIAGLYRNIADISAGSWSVFHHLSRRGVRGSAAAVVGAFRNNGAVRAACVAGAGCEACSAYRCKHTCHEFSYLHFASLSYCSAVPELSPSAWYSLIVTDFTSTVSTAR